MPDGKEHEISLPTKGCRSWLERFYAQILVLIFGNEVCGQIQVRKKTPKE